MDKCSNILIDELLTLVDGAKTVVELYNVEAPAQKVWKERWLQKATIILKGIENEKRIRR